MKVFTVGLDQHPKMKELVEATGDEKSQPPPGYASSAISMADSVTPAAVVVRKSRGYKGVLMVMLAVFLMAVFALTISEMAYNRQRDENFFRLRWAELRHRWLGYGGGSGSGGGYGFDRVNSDPAEYLRRLNADRMLMNAAQTTSTTPTPTTTTTQEATSIDTGSESIIVEDSGPQQHSQSHSSSSSASAEQPMDGIAGLRGDARLEFLRRILKKIKQHAEEMGFDGTMQVSVIEVEPQELFSAGGHGQFPQPGAGGFFPRPLVEQMHKPPGFLDGFSEFNQPTFMQTNQVGEEPQHQMAGPGMFPTNSQPPMSIFGPWQQPPQQQMPQQGMEMGAGPQGQQQQQQWIPPHVEQFPQSMPPFFRFPMQWQMVSPMQMPVQQMQQFPQQQQQMVQWPQQMQFQQQQPVLPRPQQQWTPPQPPQMGGESEFAPPQQPAVVETAESNTVVNFSNPDGPSQEVIGENYGRKFGRVIQDIIANRMQQNQQQAGPGGEMPMVFPAQPQIHMVQTLPMPTQNFQFQGETAGMPNGGNDNGQQQQFQPPPMPAQLGVPQWPPTGPIVPSQPEQAADTKDDHDEERPQQSGPASSVFFPLPNQGQPPQQRFIPPEDRIQIEPPAPQPVSMQGVGSDSANQQWSEIPHAPLAAMPPPQPQQQQQTPIVKPVVGDDDSSDELQQQPAMKGIIVDNNSGPNGWTHQQQVGAKSQEKPVDEPPAGNTEDKWLIAPPSFGGKQETVDFPPVKFPTPSAVPPAVATNQDDDGDKPQSPADDALAKEQPKAAGPGEASASAIPASPPRPIQVQPSADRPMQMGGVPNVLFQVDDPSIAIDQPQQEQPVQRQPVPVKA